MYYKKYNVLKYIGNNLVETFSEIAVEETIEIFVNKMHVASILATPEMIKELGIGYIICEGIVKNKDEIKSCNVNNNAVYIDIDYTEHFELWRELRSSGCVGIRWNENEDVFVNSDTIFSPDIVKKSVKFIESDIHKKTGGTHAACLINSNGDCIKKAVDIGRHNAFDKISGYAYLEGIELKEHFLFSTGRQSAGMVLKAARAGIPLVATKTAPFNTGIEAANRCGVCLVCFVSEEILYIFTHKDKLGF